MSLPPIRFTTMSWEKTASPCGRPAPNCAVDCEVPLGDLDRLARIGDVEDVDVLELQVVDEHDVPAAVLLALPREGGVRLVRLRLRLAVGLRARGLGEVARALDQLLGPGGVAHVDERDAADAVRRPRAPLVLVDEQVALERRRVHRHDLRALARERVDVARDEALLDRLRRVRDVHDLHAAAAARRLVEHRQVGVVALGRDVGDAAELAELGRVDDLADDLQAVLAPRQRRAPGYRALGAVAVDGVHVERRAQEAVGAVERRRVRAGRAGGDGKSTRRGKPRAGDRTSLHVSPFPAAPPTACRPESPAASRRSRDCAQPIHRRRG